MLKQVVAVINRSDTLVQDTIGALALFAMLMAGLYLPGL